VDVGFHLGIHVKPAKTLLLLPKDYSWTVRQEMDAERQARRCKRRVGEAGMLL